MRLLNSQPNTAGVLDFFLPKGQYGIIAIEYNLVAAAGVTLTRAQLGNVILKWKGQDVINCDAETLNLLDNVYGGVAEFSSAIGGVCRMMVFIRCGQWSDSMNVYDVGELDRVEVKLDYPALIAAGVCASGNISVYVKDQVGVMNYLNCIVQKPELSAGGLVSNTYPVNNVSQMYLRDPATSNVTNVQIRKDGKTVIDCPVAALNAYSDWIHVLETTNTMIVVEFGESKDVRENMGGQIDYQYQYTAPGGTLNQYFNFLSFTPNKAVTSRVVAQQTLQEKIGSGQVGSL